MIQQREGRGYSPLLLELHRLKKAAWAKGGGHSEESWTPSPPAHKISVFISKGTCAEAVGEKGDQEDWGKGAKRKLDSDSEMDVEA